MTKELILHADLTLHADPIYVGLNVKVTASRAGIALK